MFDLSAVSDNWRLLAQGLWLTVELSAAAIFCSTLLGVIVALARYYRTPVVSQIFTMFVVLARGTPILLALFIVYFVVPFLTPLSIPPFFAALIALTARDGAYASEVCRGGLLAIPLGHIEAGLALGFSPWSVFKRILFPEGRIVALPALAGVYANTVKDTSLAALVGYIDIMYVIKGITTRSGDPILVFGVAALIYIALCYPLSWLSRRFDAKALLD
jgi:polar amino acid transport system permease protein